MGHFLSEQGCWGESHFAYRSGRGARDVLVFFMLTLLAAMSSGRKEAVYCDDVSGAFGRVSVETLVRKLRWQGLCESMTGTIEAWLRERAAVVCVGGVQPACSMLRDMVFQGTVFGPCLWNVFSAMFAWRSTMLVFRSGFR